MNIHQQRVNEFMNLAKQPIPNKPTLPDDKTRKLRAKLIFEECWETIRDLGFDITLDGATIPKEVGYTPNDKECLKGIADGCADISVVTMGCASACGIDMEPVLEEVDNNNLAKFGPGHSYREDGKLIKPPNHKPPNLADILIQQGAIL